MLRIGSLCSGIGGLELGLERAGLGKTVWQAEIDTPANRVLARHWPNVPNLGDFTDVNWWDDALDYGDEIARSLEVDVICAGYPCQPFSLAGNREGANDDRHLWPAVRDAISCLGPRLVVLENVRGHLSSGFGDVLGDLADLGFDAEWCLLRASDVGGCHQRARLFVLAYPAGQGPQGRRQRNHSGMAGREAAPIDPAGVHRPPVTDPDGASLQTQQADGVRDGPVHDGSGGRLQPVGGGPDDRSWGPYVDAIRRWERLTRPAPPPTDNGRLLPRFVEWMMGFDEGWVDGLTRAQALRCLGNAVVPQVAERFGRMILDDDTGGIDSPAVLLPTPTANQPGGTAEAHLARKNKHNPGHTRVTDLGMVVEQVLR